MYDAHTLSLSPGARFYQFQKTDPDGNTFKWPMGPVRAEKRIFSWCQVIGQGKPIQISLRRGPPARLGYAPDSGNETSPLLKFFDYGLLSEFLDFTRTIAYSAQRLSLTANPP
jgi:hypothetical protein